MANESATNPELEELRKLAQRAYDSWPTEQIAVGADTVLELLNELARVRGLLQRLEWAGSNVGCPVCPICNEYQKPDGKHFSGCLMEEAISGAESADIGKLDGADENGDRCDYQSAAWRCTLLLNHSAGHSPFMDEFAGGENCPDCQHSLYHHVTEGCAYTVARDGKTEQCNCGRPRPDYIEKESARVAALPMEERCKAGSAETGGEKA